MNLKIMKKKKNNKKEKERIWYTHLTRGEGFKIEITYSLALSTPTFNFPLSFVISNASHMLGFIKLKIITKVSKKNKQKRS